METKELSGKKVILIDDEELLLSLMTMELESMGFEVTVFENCQKALDGLSLSEFEDNIVITDQSMPGIQGCDFLFHLAKELKNKRPVMVLVTGNSADKYEMEFPFIDLVLEKPFDFKKFPSLLEPLLKKSI